MECIIIIVVIILKVGFIFSLHCEFPHRRGCSQDGRECSRRLQPSVKLCKAPIVNDDSGLSHAAAGNRFDMKETLGGSVFDLLMFKFSPILSKKPLGRRPGAAGWSLGSAEGGTGKI